MSTLKVISIGAGVVSATCWLASAFVDVGGGHFFWDEGPDWIIRNLQIAKYLNASAALTSGISVLTQALR